MTEIASTSNSDPAIDNERMDSEVKAIEPQDHFGIETLKVQSNEENNDNKEINDKPESNSAVKLTVDEQVSNTTAATEQSAKIPQNNCEDGDEGNNAKETQTIDKEELETSKLKLVEDESDIIDDENEKIVVKRSKKMQISDDDDDELKNHKTNSMKIIRSKLMDSESEEDEIVTPHNKSFEENVNSEENEIALQKSRLNALCDSDSSDDERPDVLEVGEGEEQITPIPYKKKYQKKQEEKEPKMTGKQAMEQRQEIEAESQRRLRESHVSLPYHKPKQHSLKEFLQRRSKFNTSTIIGNHAPAMAIKISGQKLSDISKKLEEREREALEFFKSESESEEESNAEQVAVEVIKEKLDQINEDNTKEVSGANETENVNMETGEINETQADANMETDEIQNKADCVLDQVTPEENELVVPPENRIEVLSNIIIANSEQDETRNDDDTEYEFNLDDIDESEDFLDENEKIAKKQSPTLSSKLELIKKEFANSKPKLSGSSDFVIDLDENVTKPSKVSALMQRFVQHACKLQHHNSNVELSVVSVTGQGDIVKEKVFMKRNETKEPPVIDKPGTRLKELRSTLESQMAERRSEMWKQKKGMVRDPDEIKPENVYEGEKSECGAEERDILDDFEEEECELSDSEEEETAGDVGLEDEERSKSPKCAFADDEANESETEGNEAEIEPNEDDGDDEEEEEDADNEMEESDTEETQPKKPLRRIIKKFDDSDDSDDDEIKLTNDSVDEDEVIPLGQRNDRTPKRPIRESKSELGFLTPINHLTGLQNATSDSKFLQESPNIHLPPEPSPLKGNSWQKKLFNEVELQSTQDNLEEIAGFCSGKFPTTQQAVVETEPSSSSPPPTTQDLLDICSGKFTGVTQAPVVQPVIEEFTVPAKNKSPPVPNNRFADDDEDKFISQLLDEEEMEKFKKKFVSPTYSQAHGSMDLDPAVASKIDFADNSREDDDDDDDEEDIVRSKGKKRKAIVDSDDDEQVDAEENIDLCDNDDDDEEEDPDMQDDVAYDSEENEIDASSAVPAKQEKLKLTDFFENEAELSESEWGSADEDEKGLDELEFELGDTEKLDETKVRRDLERIHMRQVLDDDVRNVKLLQEMLLEDGELHGAGRQKQFRWKNLGNDANEQGAQLEGNENHAEEDVDDELEWRRKRFEREIYLKQKNESCDVNPINSQVLRLGQKAIIKNSPNSTEQVLKTKDVNISQNFLLQSKRGSFLTRTDQVLTRLAEYTKVTETVKERTANRNRNFVFRAASTQQESVDKKRKAPSDGTPAAIKKLRMNATHLSPAGSSKSGKNKAKNLFAN